MQSFRRNTAYLILVYFLLFLFFILGRAHFPKPAFYCSLFALVSPVFFLLYRIIRNGGIVRTAEKYAILRDFAENIERFSATRENGKKLAPKIKVDPKHRKVQILYKRKIELRRKVESDVEYLATILAPKYELLKLKAYNDRLIFHYNLRKNSLRFVFETPCELVELLEEAPFEAIPLDMACSLQFFRDSTPHLLIVASSGNGKTYFLRYLTFCFLQKGAFVCLIDPKRTLSGFRILQNVSLSNNPENILRRMQWLTQTIEKREIKLQRKTGGENPDLLAIDIGIQPIIVVIDEFATFADCLTRDEKKDFDLAIKKITQRGRQVNVHLVIATQMSKYDSLPTEARANTKKIVLGHIDKSQFSALGLSGPKPNLANDEKFVGHLIGEGEDFQRFLLPTLKPDFKELLGIFPEKPKK